MKGAITLAIYIAIGITGAAFGQDKGDKYPPIVRYDDPPPKYYPIPPSMAKAFATPLLDQLAAQSAGNFARVGAGPLIAPPSPPRKPIVISYGNGGRIDEHRRLFEGYAGAGVKVEIRGPCYSACTLLLGYVERDKLCIAPGAFMAFHAVRGEKFGQYMPAETRKMYETYPPEIQGWIDHSGGWHNMPTDGFWTMYDHSLWALGYPKCN